MRESAKHQIIPHHIRSHLIRVIKVKHWYIAQNHGKTIQSTTLMEANTICDSNNGMRAYRL